MPAKAALDEQLRRLHKALCDVLRRKAMADVAVIEEFMQKGNGLLEGNMCFVEDIEDTRQAASELVISSSFVPILKLL